MFYAVSMKKIKKVASVTLLFASLIILCRFVILPKILFPQKYSEYVEKYSELYNLDPNLVYAVIHTESGFDPDAVSHKKAQGLMQITLGTATWGAAEIGLRDFNEGDLFDPDTNVQIGCWYLNKLINQFDGVVETAIAAYNAGSGNVSKWLKNQNYSCDGIYVTNIPFEETKKYVKKIEMYKKIYERLYNSEN